MTQDPKLLSQTPLNAIHRSLDARMVEYADWSMPVSYPIGTVAEVRACRSSAGLFDVSHMGEVEVSGPDACGFLQFITTNDISKLEPGGAQYSMFLTDAGTVIDDIIVYRKSDQGYVIVVNAGCRDKDIAWIHAHAAGRNMRVEDISSRTALIAIQGPDAVAIAARFTDLPIADLKRFCFLRARFLGKVDVTFSRTGYTGEDGFEIFCDWNDAPLVWEGLQNGGASACGLASRDVLRLEASYPLYGHELDDQHTPFESGTGWAVKIDKGDFVGRDRLIAQKLDGLDAKMVAMKMTQPPNAIPRQSCPVLRESGEDSVGMVVSGTLSPTLGYGIGMARVEREFGRTGALAIVDIRGRLVQAEIVKAPFYRNGV